MDAQTRHPLLATAPTRFRTSAHASSSVIRENRNGKNDERRPDFYVHVVSDSGSAVAASERLRFRE